LSSAFVISLDFELLWGVKDHRTIESYGKAILGGRAAITNMLSLFIKEEIHATWATVGMLMFEGKEELLNNLPLKKPIYINSTLSNYNGLEEVGLNEKQDSYHFGKTLLDQILQVPFQELASHTFSHYYCLEEGQSLHDFSVDTDAFVRLCESMSIKPTSIVFPRNQYNPSYIEVLKPKGFSSFRGNESHALYTVLSRGKESQVRRLLRLVDSYYNISGHHTYLIEKMQEEKGLLNIPSSRFLRPYNTLLSFMEKRKIKRIKDSMSYAAMNGEVFHLWWHPHNFGTHQEYMMNQLVEIIAHYKFLQQKFGMESMNMQEVTSCYYNQTH
jgi:hypothetical protein